MVRTVGALLAATLAGPYTYLLLSWLTNFALDPSVPSLEASIMALPMLMFMGTVGLVLAGVPALLLGASALGFAWKLGLYSRRYAVSAGAIIGSGFAALYLDSEFQSETVQSVIIGALSGAICGWIYWRIAIGRTPDDPHAIDPA
jgi:hypothetical protein